MEYSVWKSLPHSPERGDTCSIQHLHQLASTTRSVQHMALPVFTPAAPKWLGGRAPYVARRSGYFFPFFFPPDPAPAPLFLFLLYAAYALFLGFPALLSSSFFFAFAARFKASASASRLRRSSGVPSSSVKAGHG